MKKTLFASKHLTATLPEKRLDFLRTIEEGHIITLSLGLRSTSFL